MARVGRIHSVPQHVEGQDRQTLRCAHCRTGSEGSTTSVVSLPAGAQVAGVAVGAGAVWVANGRSGTVLRIDPPTTLVVATIPVAEPSPGCERCWGAVAAHGDAVWATINSAGPVVVRIDAQFNRVVATIPVGIVPDRLTVDDEEGAVWLTSAVEDAVVRVDPALKRSRYRQTLRVLPIRYGS